MLTQNKWSHDIENLRLYVVIGYAWTHILHLKQYHSTYVNQFSNNFELLDMIS